MEVIFLVVFWQIALDKPISEIKTLVSYFLVAQSVSLIVMARRTEFGTELRKAIKYGTINIYLVRPIRIIPYLYANTVGNQGLSLVLSIILIVVSMFISPPSNALNIVAFLFSTLIAVGIALSFNLVEGIFAFRITETGPVAGSIRRIIEVFSGAIAPLSFFPDSVTNILKFTPFPAMVYGPVTSLELGFDFLQLGVGLFWMIILNLLTFKLWHMAIKHYEAIGM
jgi:ABC-2 type transport system permease protein